MRNRVDLTLFAHVVARPDAQIDLAQAALLIAETEHPELDSARYVRTLDRLGEQAARAIIDAIEEPPFGALEAADGGRPVECLLRFLYEEAGFQGNTVDYYDPRNSFLNHVIDRRMGIPITLAVVMMEVGKRAGIEVQGVSFPGHFLARVEGVRGPTFIDPFDGRALTREDLRSLYARVSGERHKRDPDTRLLEAASKKQILVRILNNLRGIYAAQGDLERLRGVLERMDVLAPSEEVREKLEELGGSTPWPTSTASFTLH